MKACILGTVVLLILISLYFLGIDEAVKEQVLALRSSMGVSSIILLALLYALLLAIPFVAGVEIGICLMGVFGIPGILAAYLGALMGLSLSYFIGKRISLRHEHRKSTTAMINRLRAFSFFVPRWLSFALLINTPGNSIFGGGGGIAMAFGMDQKLRSDTFIAVIVLATTPVPLMVYFEFIQFT